MYVFGQKWFHSVKVVELWQKLLYSGKSGCNFAKWLHSGKNVCIRSKLLYSGKMVVFG